MSNMDLERLRAVISAANDARNDIRIPDERDRDDVGRATILAAEFERLRDVAIEGILAFSDAVERGEPGAAESAVEFVASDLLTWLCRCATDDIGIRVIAAHFLMTVQGHFPAEEQHELSATLDRVIDRTRR